MLKNNKGSNKRERERERERERVTLGDFLLFLPR